jgi:hypothetical protein
LYAEYGTNGMSVSVVTKVRLASPKPERAKAVHCQRPAVKM